jgi:hypothetical protein
MKKCLMIHMKNLNLFTYEKNLPQLIEFSKLFNAEISTVQTPNETVVLELEELVPALCEKKNYKNKNCEVIKINLKSKKKISTSIQAYITKTLLKGNLLSIKDLKKKFEEVTDTCLCNHFRKIRKELIEKGYKITKTGVNYKIESSS